MEKKYCWLLLSLLLGACTQHAYFQSPLLTNTAGYKTIPLKSQNQASATYASGAVSLGNANENGRDRVRSFNGAVHRSHNWGVIQAFYGAAGTLGEYKVRPVVNGDELGRYRNLNLNASLINARQGNKFFGSLGLTGGANLVLPFPSGGEWRVIGTEFSWNREFGDYLQFRKGLPDSAANLIERNRNLLTLGINTDFIFPISKKGYLGIKMARVFNLRKLKGYDDQKKAVTCSPNFLSTTLHLTLNRMTGFYQMNYGTYVSGIQFGAAVRIGK